MSKVIVLVALISIIFRAGLDFKYSEAVIGIGNAVLNKMQYQFNREELNDLDQEVHENEVNMILAMQLLIVEKMITSISESCPCILIFISMKAEVLLDFPM